MLESKAKHYEILAGKMIEKLKLRQMEGYYAATKEDALNLVKEKFLTKGVSVAWGGSMTLSETGVMDYLKQSECIIYDRMAVKTPEEEKAMKANMVNADYFLMSTNAITLDGELVNIDGFANRVSFLCYGPKNVLIIAGMNKVASNVAEAVDRVKNIASPPNAIRLNRDTPCAKTGRCGDCFAEDCICSQIVITRRSSVKNRIKVILVGEELGF
ncbi:MAG: lactate utilization protein [Lachnospiraceae bacterium]|nr:lactate utilization protein [Lachnospiraceae bacterium]